MLGFYNTSSVRYPNDSFNRICRIKLCLVFLFLITFIFGFLVGMITFYEVNSFYLNKAAIGNVNLLTTTQSVIDGKQSSVSNQHEKLDSLNPGGLTNEATTDELVDGNSNGSRKFKRFDQSEIAIRSSEENTDGKTLNTTTLEALLKEIQKVKAFTVITKSPNETIDGLPTVTDASLVDSMENRANFEEIVDSVGLTPDEPETTERLDEDSTELVLSTDENLEDSTVYDVDLRFANNITDPINENDANSTNITDDGIVTTTEQLVSATDKLESRQGNIETVNIEKIENSTESNKSTTVTESTTPPTTVFPTTVIVPVQEIRIAKTAEELIKAQASLLKSSSTEQPTTETVATVTARKMNIKREIEYRHDGPMRKFKRKRQDQDVIVRPAPRRMTLKERLENETSVERAERVNRALQKMMQFASIVGQVDSYITGRIRTSVKKLARMYDEDEREARNRRSSF